MFRQSCHFVLPVMACYNIFCALRFRTAFVVGMLVTFTIFRLVDVMLRTLFKLKLPNAI